MKTAKIYLDSDIFLDIILMRNPHYVYSQRILALIESSKISGYTSSLILANCYYIIEHNRDKLTADKAIRKLRSIIQVLPFTDKEIGESLNSNFKDFEDGIQYFIALNNNIDSIITRNIKDYKKSSIIVMTPFEFLQLESASF